MVSPAIPPSVPISSSMKTVLCNSLVFLTHFTTHPRASCLKEVYTSTISNTDRLLTYLSGNVVLDTGMGQLTIELYWNEAPKVNTYRSNMNCGHAAQEN
jgi:hypothetical protein